MKVKYSILTAIFLLLTSTTIQSQQLWTLDKCITYAWENNIQIKQQELAIQQNENTLLQSKMNFIPSVSASVSQSLGWGKSVNLNDLTIIQNQLSASTSASLGASLRLFEGFSRINTIKSNEVALEISLQDVEKLKNDISVNITKSFLQILLSKQIYVTAEENYKSVEEQRNRTKVLVDAGSQAYSTLLEIEAQLANEKVRVVEAKNQVTSNLLSLTQLLDLDYSPDFDIVDPNIDIFTTENYSGSLNDLFESALRLPQIKSAELSLERSEYQLKIAKGRQFPTISMSGSYGTFYSNKGKRIDQTDTSPYTFFEQFNDNRNPSLGFSMSIPIFSNFQIRTSIRNADLTVQNYELELRNRQQGMFKEIQTAVIEAEALYQRYLASQENLKASRESFRYVEEKFNVGTLNATDYTVAKNNLFSAQSAYYQSKYQYIFQTKIIDFYRGIPITL